MRRKSNYDVFANRGDPWDAPEPRPRPVNLTGDRSLPISARSYLLTKGKRPPLGSKPLSAPHGEHTLSLPNAEHQQPISVRLAKERNHVVPSEQGSEIPRPSLAAAARAKLLQARRSRHVKVS